MSIKKPQEPLITLVGPPNSGKTTLFNFLSGKKYKTVNYPGATIEYSITKFLNHFDITGNLMDSPGIVSMVPNSPDEKVTVENLIEHPEYGKPSVLVVTIDASQFSRHLLLAKQIINCGFNVIVALTMNDILEDKNLTINTDTLSDKLKCKVIKVDPRTGTGILELISEIKYTLKQERGSNINHIAFEEADIISIYKDIEEIENTVLHHTNVKKSDLENANMGLFIKGETKSLNRPDNLTMKIDSILLHKYWGIFIFASVMGVLFASIFWIASPLMELVDSGFRYLSDLIVSGHNHHWFSDLLSSGIIGGAGAVMVFLPQILILFFILGLLEDSGYLARGAMLIDKPLSKLGLNGRSFVPMLSGFACAIPAIMAARTITNKKERILTIFIIPLMSCSARLPVYGLLLTFLLPGKFLISGIILSLIYLFGILTSFVVSSVINKYQKTFIKVEDNSSFIMELPVYRIPKIGNVFKNTYDNAYQYIRKAGPTILIFSVILWALTYFPNNNPEIKNSDKMTTEQITKLIDAERISGSYASELGKFIEPVMKPLGLDWRVGVSLIATFAAREIFVSSMALIFKITDTDDNLNESLISAMRQARIGESNKPMFTTSTIAGLIIFFVFALQCISTIAITKKETGGWRIPILQLFIYSGLAYFFAFVVVNGLQFLGVN
ncbi:MAG: ferrous iron transport protein B [Ignavibacteriota bacterium]